MVKKPINDGRFHWLSGDINYRQYGGMWYRQDSESDFTAVEMINMEDACGDISTGMYKSLIYEISIDNERINKDALRFSGQSDTESDVLVILECIARYAPIVLASFSGNNFHKLLAQSKSY